MCLMALTPVNRCSEMVEINYPLKLIIVPLCILAVKSVFVFVFFFNTPALLTEIGLVGKQRKKVVKKKSRNLSQMVPDEIVARNVL